MSKITIHNQSAIEMIDRATGQKGVMYKSDRIVERGKGEATSTRLSFNAIFTFDEPVVCLPEHVPEGGGFYFMEDGKVEVTQIIERSDTDDRRAHWLKKNFKFR